MVLEVKRDEICEAINAPSTCLDLRLRRHETISFFVSFASSLRSYSTSIPFCSLCLLMLLLRSFVSSLLALILRHWPQAVLKKNYFNLLSYPRLFLCIHSHGSNTRNRIPYMPISPVDAFRPKKKNNIVSTKGAKWFIWTCLFNIYLVLVFRPAVWLQVRWKTFASLTKFWSILISIAGFDLCSYWLAYNIPDGT